MSSQLSYDFVVLCKTADKQRLPGVRAVNWWTVGFLTISWARQWTYGMSIILFMALGNVVQNIRKNERNI